MRESFLLPRGKAKTPAHHFPLSDGGRRGWLATARTIPSGDRPISGLSPSTLSLFRAAVQPPFNCAHRGSTVCVCALCEHRREADRLARPRLRVARAREPAREPLPSSAFCEHRSSSAATATPHYCVTPLPANPSTYPRTFGDPVRPFAISLNISASGCWNDALKSAFRTIPFDPPCTNGSA